MQRANKQERNKISSWGAEQVVMSPTLLQGTVIPARTQQVFLGVLDRFDHARCVPRAEWEAAWPCSAKLGSDSCCGINF